MSELKNLTNKKATIVRAIPLPPISLRRGPVPLFPPNKKARNFFNKLGTTVEINNEMYQLTLADFKAGNSPIMAVFGMKTAHIMSEVAYKNALIDWQIARYQLHKVLGLVNPIIK